MDKHPYDWGIHFMFLFVYTFISLLMSNTTLQAILWITCVGVTVSIMIEFEQWNLYWKSHYKDFTEYILDFNITTGDLIADGLGIIAGILVWRHWWA